MIVQEPVQAAIWHCLNHYDYRNAVFLSERLYAEVKSDDSLFLLATAYYRNGQKKHAYHILRERSQFSSQCKYLMSICAYELEKYAEAEETLLKCCPPNNTAEQQQPPPPPQQQQLNMEDVISEFGELASFALTLLGKIAAKTERKTRAIEMWRRALKLNPFQWTTYEMLCQLGDRPNPQYVFQTDTIEDFSMCQGTNINNVESVIMTCSTPNNNNTNQHNNLNNNNNNVVETAAPTSTFITTPRQLYNTINGNSTGSNANPSTKFCTPDESPMAMPLPLSGFAPISLLRTARNNHRPLPAHLRTNAVHVMDFKSKYQLNYSSDTAQSPLPSFGQFSATPHSTPTLFDPPPQPANSTRRKPPPGGGTPHLNHHQQQHHQIDAILQNSKPVFSQSTNNNSSNNTTGMLLAKSTPNLQAVSLLLPPPQVLPPPQPPPAAPQQQVRRSSRLFSNNNHHHNNSVKENTKSPSGRQISGGGRFSLTPKSPRKSRNQQQQNHFNQQQQQRYSQGRNTRNTPVVANENNNARNSLDAAKQQQQQSTYFLQQAINMQRASADGLMTLLRIVGEAYVELQHFNCKVALAHFERLPPNQLHTTWVYSQMALAHFALADYDQCVSYFDKCHQLEPYRLDHMDVYSTALWHLQREVQLSALAQDLMEADRYSPITWCVNGNCFSLHKEHDTAIKYFQRAVQVDPRFPYAYTLLGHEYITTEELDKAMSCFRNAVRLDARHYNAWFGIGTIYAKQERYTLAEMNYSRAVAINPQSAVMLCHIGIVQHNLKQTEKALNTFNLALTAHPTSPQCKFHRAFIYFALSRYEDALDELEELKQIVPKESLVYHWIGKVHQKLGNTDLALMHLNWANDLDPKVANSQIKAFDSAVTMDGGGSSGGGGAGGSDGGIATNANSTTGGGGGGSITGDGAIAADDDDDVVDDDEEDDDDDMVVNYDDIGGEGDEHMVVSNNGVVSVTLDLAGATTESAVTTRRNAQLTREREYDDDDDDDEMETPSMEYIPRVLNFSNLPDESEDSDSF